MMAMFHYREALSDVQSSYPLQARLPFPLIGATLVGVFVLLELLLKIVDR